MTVTVVSPTDRIVGLPSVRTHAPKCVRIAAQYREINIP